MSPMLPLPPSQRNESTGYDTVQTPQVESTGHDIATPDEIGFNERKQPKTPRAVSKLQEWNDQGNTVTLDYVDDVKNSRSNDKVQSPARNRTSIESPNVIPNKPKENVIDVFRGRIVGIEQQTAFVQLTGEDGVEFSGCRALADFEGICDSVGDYFSCRTVSVDGNVETVIGPPVRMQVSKGELAKLMDELNDIYSE